MVRQGDSASLRPLMWFAVNQLLDIRIYHSQTSPPLPHRKRNQVNRRCIRMQEITRRVQQPASPAVFSIYRMQLTLHTTRRTPHGTSYFVQETSAWSVKTRRAPSRHCRDAREEWLYDFMAMHDNEYAPRSRHCSLPPAFSRLFQNEALEVTASGSADHLEASPAPTPRTPAHTAWNQLEVDVGRTSSWDAGQQQSRMWSQTESGKQGRSGDGHIPEVGGGGGGGRGNEVRGEYPAALSTGAPRGRSNVDRRSHDGGKRGGGRPRYARSGRGCFCLLYTSPSPRD